MDGHKEKDLAFQVDDIPVEGLSGRRILDSSWFVLPSEADDPIRPIELREPIVVDFRLERAGSDVRVELALATSAALVCARCLEPLAYPVRPQTRFTFCRAHPFSAHKGEVQLYLEDMESAPFEGDEIDLSDLIYEQIVLSFPIKPLCHEACKGLCPHCGTNRNIEDCGCSIQRVDPRWGPLSKLKPGA